MPNSRTLTLILPVLLLVLAAVAAAANLTRPAGAGSSDLVVQSFYNSPPVVNLPVDVQIQVVNEGESTTGDFTVEFYRDRIDAPGAFDVGDESCSIPSLGPHWSQTCYLTLTYLASGQYMTWVQLDREGNVFESDETNNIYGPNYFNVQPDSDVDGVGDQDDNCLFWPNPNQALPSWPVPPNDSDCDGFTNAREQYLQTDVTLQCAANDTANNEPLPDSWPLDMNDDQRANTVDVGSYVGKLGLDSDETGWVKRLDLNQSTNGLINSVDVGMYVGRLGKICSTAGS